jgi:tetratricopeptide (TPR) repeat protein
MEELRLVYAKPGDQVSVHLDRQGWVYLGEDRRRSGVNYVSRHILDGSTQFVFEAEELGDYILRFQYQDLSEGVLREEGIRLSVVQEDAFRRAVASGTQESSEPRTSPLTRARNLAAEGRHAEAVELSESAVGRLSPEDMHRLAELYHGLGRIEPAVRLWRENLEADGEWSQRAAAGILAAAPAANDRQAFQDALDASPDAYLRIPPKDLVLASEKASAWGLVSQAIRMLEHALASQRGFDTDDEAYYLLARLYEQDTPLRNARKALELYTVIVEDMRRSRRWEAARERKLYLERHFFHVR